ncbi:unnamed protein product [Cylindrotheca closterium]|uniref:PhoD-like phosphatase metallophosphatase domain-containing protein n=1 Tax=Cylindrotheca closterium TaxID=2856 RepID=A0AAD2FXN6_9STRA|nr:unnamed protein product [Cylindrotheca closterium]
MTQPVWDEVLEKNIDFALLPGDTVYMNYKDRSPQGEIKYNRVWFRHLQQRAETHFANFISKTPIYSTWDDHDYGNNDADHSLAGKENSLAAWGHLWPNPYQGSSKGTGNYYSYSWGDVDYYVMDCRWYRNPHNGTLFGKPQMEWLEEKLLESTAAFKIIVSASDVMERGLTGDLKQIGKVVTKYSISGVVFNSGDIHRNQFKSQKVSNWPYPVVQITSSGIARVKQRPFAIITIDTNLEDPEMLTQFYIADSKERDTTWSNNATVDCHEIRKSKDRDLKQRCSKVVRLSDLTPS